MTLESFRRALSDRHAEAMACARARMTGTLRDEARLDELDADLFSLDATEQAVCAWLDAPPGSATAASARSRLAIVLEEGMGARLRPLDRAIESARRRGRPEEAGELAEERDRVLAAEGVRRFGPPASERSARLLASAVRGESQDALLAGARTLLAESARVAERLAGTTSGTGSARERRPGEGTRAPASPILPSDPGERAARIVAAWCGWGASVPAPLIAPALHELSSALDLDPRSRLEILNVGRGVGAPCVLEVDPPGQVVLALRAEEEDDGLPPALAAWGESVAPSARGAGLPEEHRLHADRAIGGAIGVLAERLAAEHAHVRREPLPAGRRALAREVASARLGAARVLERDRLLEGRAPAAGGGRNAVREASLGRLEDLGPAPTREAVFGEMDRFRGHLLAPHLRERLRTRYGNLWYRERGAGRFLREICEPGGSLLPAEILAGLSLPVPSAESLVDSWRDEIKALR